MKTTRLIQGLGAALCALTLATSSGHADPVEGKPLPTFAGQDTNNRLLTLRKLLKPKGAPAPRALVITMYGTWCDPCQDGVKRVQRVVSSMAGKPVQGLVIGVKDDAGKLAARLKELNVSMPALPDPYMAIAKRLDIDEKLPRTMVIDGNGVLRKLFTKEDAPGFEQDLKAAIESVLARDVSAK